MGQVNIALTDDGIAAQGGVAVHPLAQLDVQPHGIIGIIAQLGQFLGQIQLPRTGHPHVHLLQQNDIGIVMVQDRGDALRTKPPVNPDGPVDIIGQNPKIHG